MDIFEAYEMEDDAVTQGVWAELVLMGERIGSIRVRPSDADLNLDYRRALAKAGESLLKLKKANGELTDKDNTEATAAVYAETVLTDWELFETKDGKEVPIKFSQKKAIELLIKLPKLLKATQDAARQWTKFRKASLEEAAKS